MGILVRRVCVPLVLALTLCGLTLGPVYSGEDKEVRAIIARAMKAKGGEEHKAIIMKGAGTFYGLGEGIPYTGQWHVQGHTQMRFTLEIKVMDQALTLVQVIDGDKGWMKFNDEVKAMPAEELAEEQEEMYAKWVSSLVPLKDKAFKLTRVGEVEVDNRPAVGVRVSQEGKREVNLFFDKLSGLLVKNEHQVKDVKGGANKEMSQETYFNDFKAFKGTKYPTRVVIKRDGKQFVEANMSEIQPVDAIDPALFVRP